MQIIWITTVTDFIAADVQIHSVQLTIYGEKNARITGDMNIQLNIVNNYGFMRMLTHTHLMMCPDVCRMVIYHNYARNDASNRNQHCIILFIFVVFGWQILWFIQKE